MRKIASFRALPKWLIMSVARRRRLTTRRFAGPTLGGLFLPALEPYPYMMTPCQIAEFTGLTSQGVRKLLAAGEMRGVKFGSKWLVPKLCLLRYLNRREDGGENDEDAQMRQARGSR